ncbi:PBS lyase [Streptomyces sp. NPDC096193]|uniref:PBS lyase n=1 Tax=Streptomyces sp. NPDC096193 TaxID=3155821 RepID=UPI0033200712
MFGGINDVDWASLEHAYGPADDVPALLYGLASPDPAERESALDGMYGAVHHQGDVYDSTLACIPFLLELVGDPSVEDRGCIVELLTSIGGIDLDGDDELDPEDEEFEYAANYAMAASAVTAGADVFLALVDSGDRGVRLAAPLALATLHGDPELVLGLLRRRLAAEEDAEVRFACVEAAGRIALRHGRLASEVVEWLTGLTRVTYGAGVRLAALAQLARCAPDALPPDVVTGVTGLLRELRAEPVPASSAPERPSTPTILGQLRERHEAETAGRHAPWTADLLRTLHSGLGDRVEDRTALLTDQLCSPDWGQRTDAVRMSGALLRTWRGEYGELVGLIGEQLSDPEPRLADAAVLALGELFGLAAPAADALADRAAADPAGWVQEWPGGPPVLGSVVMTLARAGDRRAVPVLARLLELDEAPRNLGHVLDHLGEKALPLVPGLRRRLGALDLDERLHDLAGPLLHGLTALRATDALPEVLRVLRGAPRYRKEWVVEQVLRALTAFGPAARTAAPDLRGLLAGGDCAGALAVKTAAALWAVEPGAREVLPVLRTALSASELAVRRVSAAALGVVGSEATAAAPALAGLLRAPDVWARTDAAIALWRVTGDADRAWPVLRVAWETLPGTRPAIAACLAGLPDGPPEAVADEVERTLRAEISSVRRHQAMDGGYGSHDIFTDEKLLALCRRALTSEGPAT